MTLTLKQKPEIIYLKPKFREDICRTLYVLLLRARIDRLPRSRLRRTRRVHRVLIQIPDAMRVRLSACLYTV